MKANRPAQAGALAALLVTSFVGGPAAQATQHASPEQRTLEIARTLRPIPDAEWQNIAGDRASEAYAIIKGDTLYDISQRLFGDPKYWPKIWAINNRSIVNPHLIYPGNAISFMPGSGSALPAVAVTAQNDMNAEEGAPPASPEAGLEGETATDYPPTAIGRSQEWRYLPHQRWENNPQALPPGTDAQGFDLHSKIRFKTGGLTDLPSVASTDRIEFKGQIFAAASEREYLFIGDTVYIQSEQQLAPGQVYAITDEPTPLTASHSDRSGYSYRILGKVKVLAVRDKLYMGTVLQLNDVVGRGVSLIPFPERVPEPGLIPADKALEGTMIYDPNIVGSNHASQDRWVYIDRGADDGVKPGMVFRYYEHDDAITGKKITDAEVIPIADFVVIYSTAKYSTARVFRDDRLLPSGAPVSVLTSLDDVKHFETTKMKDLFGSAPNEPPPPNAPAAESPKSNEPEPQDLEQANPGGGSDAGPAPVDAPPPEGATPEQAPAEGTPPPAELTEPAPPPPPEAAPPPPEAANPPATDSKATGNGPESPPPPPPEVAPMPNLPAAPDSGNGAVQDLNP